MFGRAATISSAVLEHNVACAREGVQMATRATDAKSAIAAAEHVVDAVARIITKSQPHNKVGIITLQRPALPGPQLPQPQRSSPRLSTLQNSLPPSPTLPPLKHLKLPQPRQRQRPRLKLLNHRCADAKATPDWSAVSRRSINEVASAATAAKGA